MLGIFAHEVAQSDRRGAQGRIAGAGTEAENVADMPRGSTTSSKARVL